VAEWQAFAKDNAEMAYDFRMYRPAGGVEYPPSSSQGLITAMQAAFGFVPTVTQQIETMKMLGLWLAAGQIVTGHTGYHTADCPPYVSPGTLRAATVFWSELMQLIPWTVTQQSNSDTDDTSQLLDLGHQFRQLLHKLNMLNNKQLPGVLLRTSLLPSPTRHPTSTLPPSQST